MAVANTVRAGATKDGGAYFLRPEGNPSGLNTSLESGRAQTVNNIFANVYHYHPFNAQGANATAPAQNLTAVNYSNNDLPYMPRSVWVGSGGDITVVMRDGTTGVIPNIPDGSLLPICPLKITTGTAGAIAIWW